MVIYCDRNGNVNSIPSVIPFGEKLTDITIVTPQQSATVLLKIEPPTGEFMPDMICKPIVNDEGVLVYNAKVFPGVTVAAGRCYYQLQFVGTGRHVEYDENGKEYLAEGSPSWHSEKGSFNILRGTNIDLPLSKDVLKDYALEELYTLLESITQVQYRASAVENKIGIDKELETEEKNIIDAINALNKRPSSGGSTAIEGLEDFIIGSVSPAESVGDTITWDGIEKPNYLTLKNTVNFISLSITTGYTKVSNSVPTFEQVDKNWSFSWVRYEQDGTVSIVTQPYGEGGNGPTQTIYDNGAIRLHIPLYNEWITPCVFIIPQANLEADTVTFPEAGVYIRWYEYDNRREYVTSLTIPNFNFEALPKDNRTVKTNRLPYAVTEAAKIVPQIAGGVEINVKNGSLMVSISELMKINFGVEPTVHIQVVNALPDVLLQSDLEIGAVHLYVINETGIAYGRLGDDVMTLGVVLFESTDYDKGWLDIGHIPSEDGVYTVRRESILIDKTFTQSGKAADAYEVGKLGAQFEERISALENIPFAEEVSV